MGQSRHRFEDMTAICRETLQIIHSLIPPSATLGSPQKIAELHRFPRYVFEELHNLSQLVKSHGDPAFDELLRQMATLAQICRSLDPSLAASPDAASPDAANQDAAITPIVIEPSHLDLIRSVVSNMDFSLLGLIMTRGQPQPGSSPDGDASA